MKNLKTDLLDWLAGGGKSIITLTDSLASDISVVGGKFKSLSALVKAGIKIPQSICVPVFALTDFLCEIGYYELFEEFQVELELGRPSRAKECAAQLREAVSSAAMPQKLSVCILDGLDTLHPPLAVRSSATVEDAERQSFAGMFDSTLGLITGVQILQAIRYCWESSFSERAISYALHKQRFKLGMAVICQELVLADRSGVMFTQDPLNGSRCMTIEATWGLPSLLVGGDITPDRYDLGTDGQLLYMHVGSKRQTASYQNGTIVTEDTPLQRWSESCLSDLDLRKLYEYGYAIEKHFGCAQDIEWAIKDSTLYILQSRPITMVSVSRTI